MSDGSAECTGIKDTAAHTRITILSHIAKHGILRPETAIRLGITPERSATVSDTKERDDKYVCGVIILGDNQTLIRKSSTPSVVDRNTVTMTMEFPSRSDVFTCQYLLNAQTVQHLTDISIQYGLYLDPAYSVLPVIMEKAGESLKARLQLTEEELSARSMSSIVIVTDATTLPLARCSKKTATDDIVVEVDIPREQISAILAPESILADVTQVFPEGIPIISVGNRKARVAITEKHVRELTVPDYESALRKLVEPHDSHPLFIHGVRLPFPETLRYDTNPAHAPRRFAA